MDTGLSASDVLAMTRDGDNNGLNGIWSNPFIYLVWMYAMRWFNNNGTNSETATALNQAQLFDGLGRQDVLSNQRSILDGLCNINGTVATGFGDIKYDNLSNLNTLQNAMTNGFYNVQSGLCGIQGSIANLSAENYRNTCDITNAIHNEGEATRALINSNAMQELRDKLEEKDRNLLFSNLLSAQQAQTSNLVNQLRPFPIPAYQTTSPYTSSTISCGCGV